MGRPVVHLPETDDTYWCQMAAVPEGAPCLFLDRDGVVVEEVDYLHRVADVSIAAGVREVLAAARARGMAVGLVTNQAGVGRGYYGWRQFTEVQEEIVRRLRVESEPFDFVAACGAHPQAVCPALRVADHPWRKPRPGMLLRAAETFRLDLPRSVMVGDQLSDLQAGLAASVGRVIHVPTGHGGHHVAAARELAGIDGRVVLVERLAEVADLLDD